MAGHDGYTRYTVRIPTPLYERVKDAAGEKSVNAEIVATLEEKYPAATDLQSYTKELIEFAEAVAEMPPGPERDALSEALNKAFDEIVNGLTEHRKLLAERLPEGHPLKTPPL